MNELSYVTLEWPLKQGFNASGKTISRGGVKSGATWQTSFSHTKRSLLNDSLLISSLVTSTTCATYRVESRHLSRGVLLDYAQTHIFDAVTTCGRYQGRLLLILILHSVMHDITSTLPVGVNLPLGFNAKWPPHVNGRRAPGVLR